MLVFSKAKLVFLSVPKTGTTAYQEALEPFATMIVRDPPELKHAPVYRYNRFFRPAFEKFIGKDLIVLAVMREPLDWLGSWYRYRKRPFLDGTPTSTKDISFEAFISDYMKGDKPAYADVGSQARFLKPQPNGTTATHLFRYEDQAGLTSFLQDALGVSITTDRINASPAEDLSIPKKLKARFRKKCRYEYLVYESIKPGGVYTPCLLEQS